MPGKKGKAAKVPEIEETEVEPQDQEPKKDPQVNDRLTRIEEALLRMAELQEARQEPTGAVTRGRAQKAKTTKKANPRRSVSLDSISQRDMNIDYNLLSEEPRQPVSLATETVHHADVHHDARHKTSTRPSTRGDPLTSQPGDPLASVNKPQLGTRPNHNNADCWAPWMSTPAAPTENPRPRPFNPAPNAAYAYDQDEMEQHVQSILASSVHTLSRGNVKPGAYPYKYVFRGPEKNELV